VNTPQADPLIGRLVDGRYRVRARIARGGMATVYVATDMRLERRIALKVMHAHLSDDSAFQSRFIQEARAAARLADPHVVNVFDQGQDGELAYLVMEYLPGITLRELMREQKRLTVTQTITIMDAILSGLAAAHAAGIVHRDVKPENVLLAEDGRIKIGDFGLARATTANTATGAQLLGTIAYLAPELVTRGTADARSDIYALGIMLYEMLVGEQPYQGEQPMQIAFQHATEQVPRPSARNAGVPDQLDELVLWATAKSPDDRPMDAKEMLTRLREIEREIGVAPVPTATEASSRAYDSGSVTKILPGTAVLPAADDDAEKGADNATRLRRRTARRRSTGAALLTLVLLLAVLAGAAGWWFGSGPGSLIAVPSVAGMSYEDAAAAVEAEGLVPERAERSSIDVDQGLVIESAPGEAERVEKDSTVSLVVSTGPARHDLPALRGKSADEVRSILAANRVNVSDDVEEYFDDLEKGPAQRARHPARSGRAPRMRRRMPGVRGRHRPHPALPRCGAGRHGQAARRGGAHARGREARGRRRAPERLERVGRQGIRHRPEQRASGWRCVAPWRHGHADGVERPAAPPHPGRQGKERARCGLDSEGRGLRGAADDRGCGDPPRRQVLGHLQGVQLRPDRHRPSGHDHHPHPRHLLLTPTSAAHSSGP